MSFKAPQWSQRNVQGQLEFAKGEAATDFQTGISNSGQKEPKAPPTLRAAGDTKGSHPFITSSRAHILSSPWPQFSPQALLLHTYRTPICSITEARVKRKIPGCRLRRTMNNPRSTFHGAIYSAITWEEGMEVAQQGLSSYINVSRKITYGTRGLENPYSLGQCHGAAGCQLFWCWLKSQLLGF